eukprot:s399_g42.t3
MVKPTGRQHTQSRSSLNGGLQRLLAPPPKELQVLPRAARNVRGGVAELGRAEAQVIRLILHLCLRRCIRFSFQRPHPSPSRSSDVRQPVLQSLQQGRRPLRRGCDRRGSSHGSHGNSFVFPQLLRRFRGRRGRRLQQPPRQAPRAAQRRQRRRGRRWGRRGGKGGPGGGGRIHHPHHHDLGPISATDPRPRGATDGVQRQNAHGGLLTVGVTDLLQVSDHDIIQLSYQHRLQRRSLAFPTHGGSWLK